LESREGVVLKPVSQWPALTIGQTENAFNGGKGNAGQKGGGEDRELTKKEKRENTKTRREKGAPHRK